MTTKDTQKYVYINRQLNKLSKILCNEILKYKERILKEYSIFDIAVYKNLSNLFQDNNQHVNYEFVKHFYDDFYNQYFNIFKSHSIIKEISPKIIDIMKYQWKHGDNTPMKPEESIEISKSELNREFREFFEVMFNAIFHHSYVFNFIVEHYNNIEKLQNLSFKNKKDYKIYLEKLCQRFNIDTVECHEEIFYKKASKKIISKVFVFNTAHFENLSSRQNHIFYISGIKLNNFQSKLLPGVIIRNPQINEIRITENCWDSGYDKENCIIEHSYTYNYYWEIIHKHQLIPLILKLAFKNCARIKKVNNYLEFGLEGEEISKISDKKYNGNIPVSVSNEFINQLPKLIKLCSHYIDNGESDFDNLGFINIALDFYSQALDKIHPTHKIAYACLALEALYNSNSDRVLNQITERCSILLSPILNQSQNKIKKVIRKAYEIRCAYVHAQDPLCCYDEDLVENIFDLVRYSIMVFLQIYKSKFFKNKIANSKLKFKLLINNYYLNSFELMPNLKNEFYSHISDYSWINKLAIKCDYCNYKNMIIDDYEFSNYFK